VKELGTAKSSVLVQAPSRADDAKHPGGGPGRTGTQAAVVETPGQAPLRAVEEPGPPSQEVPLVESAAAATKYPLSGPSRNVFGPDRRVPLLTHEYPFSAIGRIRIHYSSGWGHGTGTLVGRDLVLTAAHCVIDEKTKAVVRELSFQPNCVEGKFKDPARPVQYWYGDRKHGEDWAMIQIDKPLGDTYGWLGVRATDAYSFPAESAVVGYADDFREAKTASMSLHAHTRRRFPGKDTIYHDGEAGRGSSGGPMLASYGGKVLIVGLNTAEFRKGGKTSLQLDAYSDAYANIGICSRQFIAELHKVLATKPQPSR
jgi:protease YdgD